MTIIMPTTRNHRLFQFRNCFILRDHQIIREDLWVRNGKIVNPEVIFFQEKIFADEHIDCNGAIISPGFIDVQINGGFGVDFSYNVQDIDNGIAKVAHGLLEHGVTSFCPTIVTSKPEVYAKVLPKLKKSQGGKHGANILGAHIEGPFINIEKKGAHDPNSILSSFDNGFQSALDVYGSVDNVIMVTLAPELPGSDEVIEQFVKHNVTVSIGHSMATLTESERAVDKGASFITHLFNAMPPFHHRDPGLVGLLSSDQIPANRRIYYGIISDGVHTHPAALRIAFRTHPLGLVIVTDAISALGLNDGTHYIGQMAIEIREKKAFIAGTNTLCGSIATIPHCIKFFKQTTSCTLEQALEAATLHPAMALGIQDQKGCLSYGADADLTFIDADMNIWSTWISGECVYENPLLSKLSRKNISL